MGALARQKNERKKEEDEELRKDGNYKHKFIIFL